MFLYAYISTEEETLENSEIYHVKNKLETFNGHSHLSLRGNCGKDIL